MAPPSAVVIVISSTVLRTAAYVFLRWIPGHHAPPLVLASLVAYLIAIHAYLQSQPISLLKTQENTKDAESTDVSSDGAPATRLRSRKSLEKLNGASDKDEAQKTAPRSADSRTIWTLLSGLPSPSSPFWTAVTIFLNIVTALLTADVVYRAPYLFPSHDLSFTRVGYVSDTSAKILVREPDTAQLPVYISYRGVPSEVASQVDDSWKSAGQVYWLSNETDFTYALTISQLRPSTRYQYAVSNNHSGYFTTAPPPGETWPGTDKVTFLTSSCIKPRFPYNPFAHPLSMPGFKHLAKQLPSLRASFMLFLGDFIYVDVPRRLGDDAETYRREYRQVYASPDWPTISTDLPWLHVLDDHEIANDWDANTTSPYPAAVDPWHIYHTSINPPPVSPNATYFTFTHGPASFFLLDTRTYRSPSLSHPPSSPQKTMLGPAQLSALLSFLSTPSPRGIHFKFLISSIPFTRNWRFGDTDTWAAYLHERQLILNTMWAAHERIIILSGDRHEFAATAFPPPGNGNTVYEFSTSPLSMFYLPVRTYSEREHENEFCLKYVPDGNSKFGAVDVEREGSGQGVLRFRLFVDGREVWRFVLTSPERGRGVGREGESGREAIWG